MSRRNLLLAVLGAALFAGSYLAGRADWRRAEAPQTVLAALAKLE
jgi:hypothetical protein